MFNKIRDQFPHHPNIRTAAHLIILSFFVVVVYSNTLNNGFVWDDHILFIGNDFYKSFSFFKITQIWGNGVEFLPLRDLSYMIDYALWDEIPYGWHLTNLFIFLLTIFVVYFFAVELFIFINREDHLPNNSGKFSHQAVIVALLIVVHPIQSQTVSFITCRNVLLSGLFFFLALYLFLQFVKSSTEQFRMKYYLLSLLCFEFALLSKATVITLPLILIAIVHYAHSRNKGRFFFSLLPFAGLAAIWFFLFRRVASQTNLITDEAFQFGIHNLWVTLAKAAQIPFFYIYKIIIPRNFAAEYDLVFIKSILHPTVIVCVLVLGLVSWLAWRSRTSRPFLFFGTAWIAITLLPVMNFYFTNPVVADRYIYLPLFGFFFMAVSGSYGAFKEHHRISAVLAAGIVVLALSLLTHQQNTVWNSDLTLWKDQVAKSPKIPKGYVNLGYSLLAVRDFSNAYESFKKAHDVDPSNVEYEYVRAADAFNRGDYKSVISWLERALTIKPGHIAALYYMGIAYDRCGQYTKAIACMNSVCDSQDRDLKDYRSQAQMYLILNLATRVEPELKKLRNAHANDVSNKEAAKRLADALFKYGLHEEALSYYLEIEKDGFGDWDLLLNMGEIFKRQDNLSAAKEYYSKSLLLNKSCRAFTRLGEVHRKMKEYKLALKAFEAATELKSECPAANYDLAVTYFQLGNRERSFHYFNKLLKNNRDAATFNTTSYLHNMPQNGAF